MAVYKKIAHEGLGVRRFLARVLLADDFRRLGHALAGDLDHAGRDKELARRRVHARGEIRQGERLRQLLERRVVVTAEQPPAPAHDSKAAPYARTPSVLCLLICSSVARSLHFTHILGCFAG